MKRVLGFVCLVCSIFLSSHAVTAAPKIEYILDDSGSMNALFGADKRIDAAKKSIATTVQSIPDGSIVALRIYGHRVAPSDKAGSCKDSEVVIPFGPINKDSFLAAVNQVQPLGQTPIAYSLQQAALDFNPGADEQPVIILVSDGEESCGGDPTAVAKDLLAKGYKLKINVIGLDVDANAKNQLSSIAAATGGQYFDAKDAASLTGSLQKLTQGALVIQKANSSVYGEEIRGGDNYETAVALTPGKLYRLNHHQKQNQYDYFYIDGKPGQKITATVETGEKGVTIRPDNSFEENLNPYAGIGLHTPQKTQIRQEEIIGGKNDSRQIIYPVPLGGEGHYYVLVGSAYDNQNKDNRFKVEIAEQFDAGTKQDAGESRDTAISIQPGTIKGYLNPNDNVDTYKVQLPAGNLNLRLRPGSEKAYLKLELFDADGVEVGHQSAPNEGAVAKMENVNLPKAGEYILKVASVYSSSPETDYNLEIIPGSGTAPSAPAADVGAPPAVPGVPAAPAAPTQPAAAQPPAAPSAPVYEPIMKPIPMPGAGSATPANSASVCQLFKQLPLLQKAKVAGLYIGLPCFGAWLIGMIWGYVKGRKSGKRWAAKQAMKQNLASPTPPPAQPPA